MAALYGASYWTTATGLAPWPPIHLHPVGKELGQDLLDVGLLLDALDLDRLPEVVGDPYRQGLRSVFLLHDANHSTRIDNSVAIRVE